MPQKVGLSSTPAHSELSRPASPTQAEASERSNFPPAFRTDIEGLRGVAVLAVLVYHLGAGWLPGGFAGVDVFFVISGYLITGLLLAELELCGTLSLRHFWSRRLSRLLPAATLVSLATALTAWAAGPRLQLPAVAHELQAASVSLLNVLLARRSVDYLAEDIGLSPLQHYWSLGVEAQFYLAWPVLLLLLAWAAARYRWRLRLLLTAAASTVFLASFTTAVMLTARDDVRAYFLTPARLWEPAVGGLMALLAPGLARRRSSLRLYGCAGAAALVLLVMALVTIDGSEWPGWPALLPVLATGVLVLGDGSGAGVASRALSLRPLTWFGRISYPLYLWHWPLVMATGGTGVGRSPLQAVALAASAVVLATVTHHWVEKPFRRARYRQRSWSPYLLAVVSVALSWALGSVMVAVPERVLAPPTGAQAVGAAVLPSAINLVDHPDWSERVEWVVPAPLQAPTDVPTAYADGCQQGRPGSEPLTCTYGKRDAPQVVALVGDSKALQWLPALDSWTAARGVRLVTYTKTSCPFVDAGVDLEGQPYASCAQWYGRVLGQLREIGPDLVITSQFQPIAAISTGSAEDDDPAAAMQSGLVRTWRELLALKAAVVVLADSPLTPEPVYECVLEHSRSFDRCAYPRAEATAASAAPVQRAAVREAGGRAVDGSGREERYGSTQKLLLLDLTDALCPDARRCPPVVGRVLIYRSGSHLTRTYVASLTPRIADLLEASAILS